MKKTREELVREQEERTEYLSDEYGPKSEVEELVDKYYKGTDDKIRGIIRKCLLRAERNREQNVKTIKQQTWYRIKCAFCRMSNKQWMDEGRSVYDLPIRYAKEENLEYYDRKKEHSGWTYLEYYCKLCKRNF